MAEKGSDLAWIQALRDKSVLFTPEEARRAIGLAPKPQPLDLRLAGG